MSRSRHENVYVIGGEVGPQKIGISNNLESRLINLQSGRPYKLRLVTCVRRPNGDARAVERVAHHLLREKRLDGEWFGVSIEEAVQAVTRAVEMVEAGHAPPPCRPHQRNPVRPPRTENIAIRLSADVKASLAKAASADMRSMSAMAEKIIAEWLTTNGKLRAEQK
jgi:hypothetical protein